MGNGNDDFSFFFHALEQVAVKESPEFRVLVGGHFIEKINGAVFQVTLQQGQPFSLAAGQVDGTEGTVFQFYFSA